MEEKINIAAILKDKPKGTKLYSDICCGECVLNEVSENAIYVDMYNKERFWDFSVYGTIYAFPDGAVLLYPSKEMRDWRKFAWKKGDVLVSTDRNVHIIFEKFEDDAYTKFRGKHYLWEEGGSMVSFVENEYYMQTSDFNKANKEDAQEYIHKIEKILGGKLNLETLEIEKPEFKDGDIVMSDSGTIVLVRGISLTRKIYYHAYMRNEYIYINQVEGEFFSRISCIKRFATDSEKQQLFDALAKKGKTWDSEKKAIVDLKPKVELKPFDKVLVRDSQSDKWRVNLFGYIDKDEYYHCAFANWVYCIPYAGNEHLLGTTKDVEG